MSGANWYTSDWSSYSSCAPGDTSKVRTRTVACRNSDDVNISMANCKGNKPANTDVQPCIEASWVYLNTTWSTCSSSTNTQSGAENYVCKDKNSNIVDSAYCTGPNPAKTFTRDCGCLAEGNWKAPRSWLPSFATSSADRYFSGGTLSQFKAFCSNWCNANNASFCAYSVNNSNYNVAPYGGGAGYCYLYNKEPKVTASSTLSMLSWSITPVGQVCSR